MQGVCDVGGRSLGRDVVQDQVDPAGFQRRKDRPVERGHVHRSHEAVVQIVVVLGNPEHVKLLRILRSVQRRGESHGDIRMGGGVGLYVGNALDDVGVLEQRAWHAGVDVTRGADDAGKQPGEITAAGGIVADFVARLDAGERKRFNRFATDIPGRVACRTRRVGNRLGNSRGGRVSRLGLAQCRLGSNQRQDCAGENAGVHARHG